MRSMCFKRKLFLLFVVAGLSFCLSGCWFIYRPDIKQGNILTLKQVSQIRVGMSREEIIAIFGEPILVNIFNETQMIYVYTIQPGHGPFHAEQLRIYFTNGRVASYTSSVHTT
jgi:outer membrane protein assembly factor BamE (lipoprotein component of BamABCDE complex)